MVRTLEPVTASRKRRLRAGVVVNAFAAAALLIVGTSEDLTLPLVGGFVEVFFAAYLWWTYTRTPVVGEPE